ncbi:uncharacterized protein si:dkey-9i23.16 [Electrophorus electricus]|uniref:uncharacterized protein si:dkey-9i23.16 n=1 Tax=Electrophorus electricus TaxID=8005 RepID=UPI0015D05BEB|nr:uncharacterized protein si:dkey-9i23.16 [Electrophorus electricus]
MMPVPQSESAGIGPATLHRPFRFYDPEVIAVLTILLGLFQLLLGIPTYYMSINIHVLYMCPVFVGSVYVTAGSFAMACERSPSRQLLKNCLYSGICSLVAGLCAIIVYGYAVSDIHYVPLCDAENTTLKSDSCPRDAFVDFFIAIATLLFVYDIAALLLQCFLSFSAMKGLKNN